MHIGSEGHGGWEKPHEKHEGPLRVGIGGPVGSGKTALVEMLCKHMRDKYSVAAITNDIFTREDALILMRAEALPDRTHYWRRNRRLPAHGDTRRRFDEF